MEPTYEELKAKTVAELKDICKERDISGVSNAKEDTIISKILESYKTEEAEPKADVKAKGKVHAEYGKYIPVRITARDPEEMKVDGYARLNKYAIQWKWEEDIELPEMVVEFLRSKGSVGIVNGTRKFVSRFIVEKL